MSVFAIVVGGMPNILEYAFRYIIHASYNTRQRLKHISKLRELTEIHGSDIFLEE